MIWMFLDSASVGGIERHVAVVAQALKRRAIPVEIVLLDDHGDNPWYAQLSDAGLSYTALDGKMRTLAAALRKQKPGLIHTHGYKASIIGRLAAHFTRTPVVTTFHDGERMPLPTGLWQRLDEFAGITAPRIAVSESVAANLPWSSHTVDNFLLLPPPPTPRPLPKRVGFLGRFVNQKAPEIFCAIAEAAPADIEFHMWGDGPLRADLQAKHDKRVVFHGITTNVAPVLEQIGLLLMTSRTEGLPMATLEAFSAGVPVAASRVDAMPKVITHGETGWLFDFGDVDAALSCLKAWAELDETRQAAMRTACWERLRDHYSDETQLPRLMDVYVAAGYRGTGGGANLQTAAASAR